MPLSVVTYNIKTGGEDRGRPSRLPAILRVISRSRPDILALQELRGFERDGCRLLRTVAGELGMVGLLARSVLGQPVGLFVRPPGRVVRHRALRWQLHHAASWVEVTTDHGQLRVISTHLNPFSSGRRRREARWLAARALRERGLRERGLRDRGRAGAAQPGPLVLVMGDLNALDPETDHPALAGLDRLHRARHIRRAHRRLPEPPPDTRAIQAFHQAGFVDLWRSTGAAGRDITAPTTLGGGREFTGGMRIDYLLGTPSVARVARDCRVLDGGEAESASDHYPVGLTLDLAWA